jgi:hypothetical protein
MGELPKSISEAYEADIGTFLEAIRDARDEMLAAAAAARKLQQLLDEGSMDEAGVWTGKDGKRYRFVGEQGPELHLPEHAGVVLSSPATAAWLKAAAGDADARMKDMEAVADNLRGILGEDS